MQSNKALNYSFEGKTIEEIAAERSMAASTIEGHLALYVKTGQIDVYKLVSEEKVKKISDYFLKAENTMLGPAKVALNNEVDWSELRYVMNYLEFKKTTRKDPT
ncbi:MAG: hypothetical protein HC905_13035 [Bacteroidales bacterium]|nr:hypothetical protein [Bacteroidales bacterium]